MLRAICHAVGNRTVITRRYKTVGCCLLLAVLATLVVRVAAVVSETEVGWETLRTQWQDATVGHIGFRYYPVTKLHPKSQATVLLAEVDEVLKSHPQSAHAAIGAAWILDSPSTGFYEAHLKETEFASILPQFGARLDLDAVSRAETEFEQLCRSRCLELAKRATELESGDVRWWRMRSLLQFRVHSAGTEPRQESWLEVLDECARHDPNNALYDLLAALQLWNQSGRYEWEEDGYHVLINDDELFLEGTRRLASALAKPLLSFGETGFPAITESLSRTQLPLLDQADVAANRITAYRETRLLRGLSQWLEANADTEKRKKDLEAEAAICRQILVLHDHVASTKETVAFDLTVTWLPLSTRAIDRLRTLAETPGVVDVSEVARLDAKDAVLRTNAKVLFRALRNWANERGEGQLHPPSICGAIALVATSALMLVGIVGMAVSWLLARSSDSQFGVVRHTITWLLGFCLSFLALGAAPAEVIPRTVQNRIAYGCVCILMLGVAIWIGWRLFRFMRQRRFQFSITNLMGITLASAIILSVGPLVLEVFGLLDDHPPELWVPAHGWGNLHPEVLRSAMDLPKGSWHWASVQWAIASGPCGSIGLSCVVLAIWYSHRAAQRARVGIVQFWTSNLRKHWGGVLRCVGESACLVGMLFFAGYLWVAPDMLRKGEAEYKFKMTYYREPDEHWRKIQRAVRRVQTDPAAMATIEREVSAEMAAEKTPTDEVLASD